MAIPDRFIIDQEPDSREVNLLDALSQKFCGLKSLVFDDSGCVPLEPLDGENRPRRYKDALEGVLQTVEYTLETMETNGAYLLSKLSHPPLINLSKLVLSWNGSEDYYNMTSINFGTRMPRLQAVELTVLNFRLHHVHHEQPRGAVTVQTLSLELRTTDFNLALLNSLFPNVSALNLTLNGPWPQRPTKWTYAPITAICRNWPGLEEVKIAGPVTCLSRDYDADLCGISRAECC